MKKLLASLLAMVMALSLAVPAFADDPAPGVGIIGGADGPTEIITGPLDGTFNWWTADDEAIDELKTALGGVPGQIGVMVNGNYVKFPDAAPEVRDGTTMAPVRALVEAMGGKVEVDGDKVACTVGGVTMTFEMNGTDVKIEHRKAGGSGEAKTEWVTMPVFAYVKDGRAYVPVRFLAGTLGYDVGWDAYYETAILVDKEALAAEIDKDFAILNKVQAASALSLKEGESAKADLKGKVALTMASLEENKTYTADFGVSALMNSEALSGSATLNVSDALVKLLMEQSGVGKESKEEAQAILDALKKFEFILNKDGELWAHSDGLDAMAGEKNAWFGGSMGVDMDLSALLEAGTQMSSVGAVVAAMADTGSVESWAVVKQMMAVMGLYSDDKFTTSGGVATLTIGLDELMGLYKDMGVDVVEEMKSLYKEYQITMKVDGKGGVTASCKLETNAVSGVPAIKMTMDAVQSGGKADVTMEINVADMGKLELSLTSTQKAVSGRPMAEPPEGATVLDTDAPALLNP